MHKPEIFLKQIVKQYGVAILAQSRLKGLILEMIPNAEKKHINVLKRAIDEQVGVRLLEMQNDEYSVRQIKINTLKEKFKNDNAFDDTAIYIVDCFINAFGWNTNESEIILPSKEIKIGDQIWANRNLDVSHFRNGDPIPEAKTSKEWEKAGEIKQPAWCYYNNDPENGKKYGKLYNWYAVCDSRGLAPKAWHVPSEGDWMDLLTFLDGDGNKLKSKIGWNENGNGTDDYGFSALPGGIRQFSPFYNVGDNGKWWSVTEESDYLVWGCSINYIFSDVSRFYFNKVMGGAVRCLKEKEFLFKEVQIGKQIWTDRNLDVRSFRNGDPITEVRTYVEWEKASNNKLPAWCYYSDDSEIKKKYGKLYNWYAVNDPRGLAPEGWHVPSDEEWTKLTEFLGGEKVAGQKLKNKRGWLQSNGNDDFGFSALPGGGLYAEGMFENICFLGQWWSATESNTSFVWSLQMSDLDNSVNRYSFKKESYFSIRCLKD